MKRPVIAWSTRALVVAFWILACPATSTWLSQQWETPRSTWSALPAHADVAVVLGGLSDPLSSTAEHLEFNRASERLTEAVALYRAGRVSAILITSGSGDLAHPEAREAPGLAAWARAWGVKEGDLVVESGSRNTYENARLSLPLVEGRGWTSVVLVTSAWHMPRAAALFRKAGYDAAGRTLTLWPVDTQASPTEAPFAWVPHPESLAVVQGLLKEAVGLVAYRLQGYL